MPRGKRKRGVAPKAPSPEIYDTIVVKAPQAAPVKPAVSQNELPQPVTLSKCTPGVAAAEGKSASSTPAREGKNALATPAREGRRTRRTPVRGGNSTPTSQAEPTAANIKPGRTRKQLIVEKNGSPLAKKISENEQSQLLGTGDQASGTSDVGLQQHDMMEQEQVTIIGGTNDKTGEQLEGSSERSLQLLASETLAVKTSSGTMRTPNIPGIPLNGDQLLDIHMSQYQQEESDGVDTQKSGVAPGMSVREHCSLSLLTALDSGDDARCPCEYH